MLRLKDRLELQGRLSHSLPDVRQEEGASQAGESRFQGGFQGGFQDGFQAANLRDREVGYQGSPVQGQQLRLTNLSSRALEEHQQRLGHCSTQRYNYFKNLNYFKTSEMNRCDNIVGVTGHVWLS